MPSIKNYQNKKSLNKTFDKANSSARVMGKHKRGEASELNQDVSEQEDEFGKLSDESVTARPRRRPGRDSDQDQAKLLEAEQTEFSGLDSDHETSESLESEEDMDTAKSRMGPRKRGKQPETEPEYVPYKANSTQASDTAEADEVETHGTRSTSSRHRKGRKSGADSEGQHEKTRIEFPFSGILRDRVPVAFELAEAVADEWKQDGDFEHLPLNNPLANAAAAFSLKRAKNVEKKLEEKGVLPMARMGIEFLKSKIKR